LFIKSSAIFQLKQNLKDGALSAVQTPKDQDDEETLSQMLLDESDCLNEEEVDCEVKEGSAEKPEADVTEENDASRLESV
jgi:hypothetical protein